MFIYPTNEMSSFYGSGTNAIVNFWIEKPAYIYGLIFLFLSLLLIILSIVYSSYILIRKNSENGNMKILLIMLKIYFLFIPVTILVYLMSKSLNGSFHYLYSIFAMSFLPIFILFVKNEDYIKNNKIILCTTLLLLFMNNISMFGQLSRYFSRYEGHYSYDNMLEKTLCI